MVEGNGNLATIQPTAKAQRTQRKKGHITFSLLQISRYARHFFVYFSPDTKFSQLYNIPISETIDKIL